MIISNGSTLNTPFNDLTELHNAKLEKKQIDLLNQNKRTIAVYVYQKTTPSP